MTLLTLDVTTAIVYPVDGTVIMIMTVAMAPSLHIVFLLQLRTHVTLLTLDVTTVIVSLVDGTVIMIRTVAMAPSLHYCLSTFS